MRQHLSSRIAVAAALAALMSQPPQPSAASARQAQSAAAPAKAKAWTARTADGQPDLTGNWSNATFTPLERPAAYANREFFTPEEAAAFAKSGIDRLNSQAADDVHYDDAIWQSENYRKAVASLRTSLIVDPPDGKLPPMTEEARRRPLPPQAGSPDRIADSWETRTLGERCITWGNDGPPMMPPGYNAKIGRAHV